jgi:hypothetical protein
MATKSNTTIINDEALNHERPTMAADGKKCMHLAT